MIRHLRKLTGAPELNRVQENLQAALGPLLDSAIVNGVQVNGAELVNGSNVINHGLGRKPLGYIIVGKNANIDVWGATFSKASLTLQASGTVTVNLWVY